MQRSVDTFRKWVKQCKNKNVTAILIVIFQLVVVNCISVLAQQNVILQDPIVGNVDVTASVSITLNPGFTAVAGSSLYAHIEPSQNSDSAMFTVSPEFGNTPSSGTNAKNFVSVITYREALTIATSDSLKHSQTITYFDGLGRPIQVNEVGASPLGNDVIQPILYDNLGREKIKPLQYALAERSGAFMSNVSESTVSNYYNSGTLAGVETNSRAYMETGFDNSPLNKVISSTGVGSAWASKPLLISYLSNENTIPGWHVDNDGTYSQNNYSANSLFLTETTDEQGNKTREYKDKQGKVVLKASFNGGIWFNTYYIYDDIDLLRCVVPPKATNPTDTSLCFSYKYDNRHRMIEKRIPGGGRTTMVYDDRDRLRCSQNANQDSIGEWSFIKYDNLNRPVITGTIVYQGDVSDAISNDSLNEARNNQNSTYGYTNLSFPKSGVHVLTATYYDDYGFITGGLIRNDSLSCGKYDHEGYDFSQTYDVTPKELVTGSMVKVLNPQAGTAEIADTMLFTTNYYDKYGHLLRSVSENHLFGIDVISNKYEDITFQLLASKQQHFKENEIDSIVTVFEYDHMGRLMATDEKINTQSPFTMNAMNYNEVGQLITKYLHSNQINGDRSFLQKVDYTYNVKGWLTKINDAALSESSDLFGMQLYYENTAGMEGLSDVPGLYNGNISGIKWNVKNELKRGYSFTYDSLSRMKTATYADGPTLATSNGYYSESVTSYDKNGNILGLHRMYNDTLVDNLQYIYGDNTNQIQQITDGGISNDNIEDYPGSSGTYDYDANGNMIEDGSRNTSLTYNNVINLPQSIDFGNDNRLNYYYTSAGTKLLKNVIPNGENANRTDYIGNFVYENSELAYILTGEGRFVPFGIGEERRFVPEYFVKDHLGNNRVVFMGTDLGGTIDVVQTSHYYPFGLTMKQTNSNQVAEYSKNKYLYNGKEIQDDELNGTFFGMVDYGARFYDPQIGRWHSVDLMSEEYFSYSPYVYVMNNSIKLIDIDGNSTYIDENGNVIAVYGDDNDLSIYQVNSKNLQNGYASSQQNVVSYTDPETGKTISNRLTGGNVVGKTVHTYSFADFDALEDGNIVPTGVIELESTWGGDKIENALNEAIGFFEYAGKAGNFGDYDFKDEALKNKPGGYYFGSQISKGIYGSARDVGNIGFGAAANKQDLPFNFVANGAGTLEILRNHLGIEKPSKLQIIKYMMSHYSELNKSPSHGEDKGSYAGIEYGYNKYKIK
jgi:RHS repeat-associated protein